MNKSFYTTLCLFLLLGTVSLHAEESSDTYLLSDYFKAQSDSDLRSAAAEVLKTDISFDLLYNTLQKGRVYEGGVERGLLKQQIRKPQSGESFHIEELGQVDGETEFQDINLPYSSTDTTPIFKRDKNSGRVHLQREGNTISIETHGVTKVRLLLSPDQFDLEQPIIVKTNGITAYKGSITKSRDTLMKWAVTDHDRTMLFAAELEIDIAGESTDQTSH